MIIVSYMQFTATDGAQDTLIHTQHTQFDLFLIHILQPFTNLEQKTCPGHKLVSIQQKMEHELPKIL